MAFLSGFCLTQANGDSMSSFPFSKLIPGGNATILLADPDMEPECLPDISARLMAPMHIQAEQVGALYGAGRAPASLPGVKPDLPHLQMMGGEFCVNATRSAALLLARQGALARLDSPGLGRETWSGELTVSGMDGPVPVLVALEAKVLEEALLAVSAGSARAASEKSVAAPASAVSLHCAARIDCAAPGVSCVEKGPGVILVSMPGIQHLLADISLNPLPDMSSPAWKAASAAWRIKTGLAGSPASGVIWYERLDRGYRIWPAVEVVATGSEHLETACGSASLALALMHRRASGGAGRQEAPAAVDIVQPSGEILRVFIGLHSDSAWIAGPVLLAAQGTAYI